MDGSVDVVIVNYNAGHWLSRCIQSLTTGSVVPRIIVVDNASTDDSIVAVQSMIATGRLTLQANSENIGFGPAVNQGLAGSNADFLLVLNPDCEVHPKAIERLRDALESAPQAMLAGPLVCDPDGQEQRACRRRTPTPGRAMVTMLGLERLGFVGVNIRDELPTQPRVVDAVSGAAVMVKRLAWEQLGGYDEDYFLHCEDLDLFYRAQLAGGQILFVPQARVIHAKGVSQSSRPLDAERHKHRGMVRYYQKFFRARLPMPLRWAWPALIRFRFALLAPILAWRQWQQS